MKKILCFSLMMCGTLLAVRPDPWLESAKESYAYSTWANQTKKNYLRPLLNYEWPVLDLSTNGVDLARRVLFEERGAGGVSRRRESWVDKNVHWFMTEVVTASNVASAQEFLMKKISRCSTRLNVGPNDIGDRCYTSKGLVDESSVYFVRNNILVHVYSRTNAVPAESVARQFDLDIHWRSMKP